MATPETPDEWLQKVKVQLKYIYSVKYLETVGGVDEKRAACWAMYDQLKPSELFPSEFPNFPVVDFRSGRIDKENLKKELQQAFARPKETDDFVDTYIIANNNRMLGPVSVSLSQPNVKLPQYISCTLIELSLAGRVVWETEDGKAAEGTTDFWKFKYKERRLIEASQLYSLCKGWHVPQKKEDLLPLMYWKEGDTTAYNWMESSRTEDGSEMLTGRPPPTWAIAHIERIENVLGEDMQVFRKDEVGAREPNKHPNAVYLLLCRFNGTGEPKVQAYAGRAEPGVANRWLTHAAASKSVMEKYLNLKTFCAKPLNIKKPNPRQLVDVIVSRLYAQGGRKFITEVDVKTHDNIVLFVYRAYGAKGDNTKANTKRMEDTEGDLIRGLKLTNMELGMNGAEPKDKKKKAENANAEAGDNTKTKDV